MNNASNHQLKVSCGVSCSSVFMTDQILSSLDPFGTESDSELENVPISLMSCLIVARVDILRTEKSRVGGKRNLSIKHDK